MEQGLLYYLLIQLLICQRTNVMSCVKVLLQMQLLLYCFYLCCLYMSQYRPIQMCLSPCFQTLLKNSLSVESEKVTLYEFLRCVTSLLNISWSFDNSHSLKRPHKVRLKTNISSINFIGHIDIAFLKPTI